MLPVKTRAVSAAALAIRPCLLALVCGVAAMVARPCAVAAGHLRDGDALFDEYTHLDRATLVAAVLERNPSIDAARQAWKTALRRYPQAKALDDPTVSYSVAPLSIAGNAPFGHEFRVGQRLPFPGKRALAGAVANAEADVAQEGLEASRRTLALITSGLLDDYYVVERSLEVNAEHALLLSDAKRAAEAQYAAGRATQQEPLQAELELAMLEDDRLALDAERLVVIAQINGLLHRDLRLALPPAADPGDPVLPAADLERLEQIAIENRPEFRAAGALVRGRAAGVRLAAREYYPDFELMTSYSSMWDMPEHRWMAGIELNVPLQIGRRRAASDEAEALLAQARSEERHARMELGVEVKRAHDRIEESRRRLLLFENRLLPVARDQIAAARAGFVAGQTPFSTWITAERSLRDVALRSHIARAELHRRVAELNRMIGQIPGLPEGGQ